MKGKLIINLTIIASILLVSRIFIFKSIPEKEFYSLNKEYKISISSNWYNKYTDLGIVIVSLRNYENRILWKKVFLREPEIPHRRYSNDMSVEDIPVNDNGISIPGRSRISKLIEEIDRYDVYDAHGKIIKTFKYYDGVEIFFSKLRNKVISINYLYNKESVKKEACDGYCIQLYDIDTNYTDQYSIPSLGECGHNLKIIDNISELKVLFVCSNDINYFQYNWNKREVIIINQIENYKRSYIPFDESVYYILNKGGNLHLLKITEDDIEYRILKESEYFENITLDTKQIICGLIMDICDIPMQYLNQSEDQITCMINYLNKKIVFHVTRETFISIHLNAIMARMKNENSIFDTAIDKEKENKYYNSLENIQGIIDSIAPK